MITWLPLSERFYDFLDGFICGWFTLLPILILEMARC